MGLSVYGAAPCQATNPAVLLGNVIFLSCKHQDKQHSKFLVAVPADTFQQHQLMVHSLFHPHNTFTGDNPSHTHLTLPNCTYLGQAHKDQEFSGPSHGHLEAAVCFRKMQSSVVPANQTSLPEELGLGFALELVGLHMTNTSQQEHGRNAEKPAALLRAFLVWYVFTSLHHLRQIFSEPSLVYIISLASRQRRRPKYSKAGLCKQICKSATTGMKLSMQRNPEMVDLPSCVHPRVSAFFLHSGWIRNHAAILVPHQPVSMGSGKAPSFSWTSCGCGARLSTCKRLCRLTIVMEKSCQIKPLY